MVVFRKILFCAALLLCLKNANSCPPECKCFGFDGEWLVDCANRNLDRVPTLPSQSTEVFLQGNAIKSLIDSSFAGLSKLKYLYLHENIISSVSENAFTDAASSLITLTLHGNQISSLPENVFSKMANLIVLNLNENSLENIGSSLLADAVNLVQVSFYDNKISLIGNGAFGGLRNLRYLGLANNRLTEAPELNGADYPDLYFVDVADNLLESLPKVPSTASQIYANGNAVKSLESATFADATNLNELLLVDNDISQIENNAFAGAVNLGWIDLTGNKLSSVSDKMFTNLPTLEGLYLASNLELNQVSTNAFTSFSSSLRRLSLNNCSLVYLDVKTVNHLSNTDLILWLGDNPWKCDCSFRDFANYVIDKDTAVYDRANVECASPSNLVGQSFANVNFSYQCQNLALIIALPIVGAVILFGLASFIFYRLQKRNKKKFHESVSIDEYRAKGNLYEDIDGVKNNGLTSDQSGKATML